MAAIKRLGGNVVKDIRGKLRFQREQNKDINVYTVLIKKHLKVITILRHFVKIMRYYIYYKNGIMITTLTNLKNILGVQVKRFIGDAIKVILGKHQLLIE